MNIKKKLKKFFTLQKRANDGFTLVELIIVIAILAILAGAAVPAYNGYTKKAREAADQRLLEAVNKAFGAACLESKLDSIMIGEAAISVGEDQTIQGLASIDNLNANMADQTKVDIATAFMFYMMDNETMTFSSGEVKSLQWDIDHFVIDKVNSAVAMVVFSNGNVATLNQAAMNALMASVFAEMGSESVKAMLSSNVDSAKTIIKLGGWAMQDQIMSAIKTGSFSKYFTPEQVAFIEENLNWKNTFTPEYSEACEMVANSAILYSAEVLAGKDANTLHAQIAATGDDSNPRATMSTLVNTGGMGGTLVTGTMSSTMYEAFINSDAGSKYAGNSDVEDALKSTDNKNAQTGIGSWQTDKYDDEQKAAMDAYDAWLKSEEGKTQLSGYMGAMTIVNDNKDNIGQDKLVEEGFENDDVNTLLDSVLGSGSTTSNS